MGNHIYRSHNKSLLLYHFVCHFRSKRKIQSDSVSSTFKEICLQIEERYEIHFTEIGLDEDHIHSLIQSIPNNARKKIIEAVNSITAKEIFRLHPEVKQMLKGGKFWTGGYNANTAEQYANKEVPPESREVKIHSVAPESA